MVHSVGVTEIPLRFLWHPFVVVLRTRSTWAPPPPRVVVWFTQTLFAQYGAELRLGQ
jgi:hypothetical protein